MKAYIVKIVGAAILAVFADMLSPAEWKKYTSVITAVILMSVIITPIMNIRKIDLMSGYREEEIIKDGEKIYSDMLKNEFSKKVADDVRTRIEEEFSLDTSVEVDVVLNDGGIEKISRITVRGNGLSEKISERIKYIYDVEEVVLNAF